MRDSDSAIRPVLSCPVLSCTSSVVLHTVMRFNTHLCPFLDALSVLNANPLTHSLTGGRHTVHILDKQNRTGTNRALCTALHCTAPWMFDESSLFIFIFQNVYRMTWSDVIG